MSSTLASEDNRSTQNRGWVLIDEGLEMHSDSLASLFPVDSRWMILLIVFVAFALAACDSGSTVGSAASGGTDSTAESSGTVKIGVRTVLSGPVQRQGQGILHSVELAVDEWNARGGVNGMMIEIVAVDDEGDPDRAVEVSIELCRDDQVVAVIGSSQSATGIPGSESLNECGLAYIAPGETNPVLTDRGLDNVNRVSPRDDDQGPALAIYLSEQRNASKVFVLDDQSAGGKGLADAFTDRAVELGIEVERAEISVGDRNFEELLRAVPADVDALVFYGFLPEGAIIARQWHELGNTQPIMGGDPLYDVEGFIRASNGASENAIVTFVGPDIRTVPDAAQYIDAFEDRYGAVSSYGPQAYEATNIVLSAIERAGSTDRAAIVAAVRETSGHEGILGIPIGFDEKGDIAGGAIYLFRVVNVTFVQEELIHTR